MGDEAPGARGRFGSRIGFIVSGIGAAVGLGNIWRFPQLTSENGGAAFVLVYLVMMAVIGLPLLWGELAVGQRAQKSSVLAIEAVAGRRWRWLGMLFIATTVLFFGYYQVIAGQALRYALTAPTDVIQDDPAGFLAEATEGPDAVAFALIVAALAALIVSRGVKRGLEKANLVMMPALFGILILLAIYAVTRPGAGPGIEFYLGVELSEIGPNTFLNAIGQVFFSVGIAFGIMLTYASYTARGRPMLLSGTGIAVSDTLVALTAGFMVFPLVFSQGLQDQVVGENLGTSQALFLTIPTAFIAIGGWFGKVLMFAFFLMLSFAALSSSIAGLEVVVSWIEDSWGWLRHRAAIIAATYAMIVGIWAGASQAVLDYMDFVLGSVLLVAGGIGLCILYAFGIRDRLQLLLGDDTRAGPAMVRAAKIFGFLLVVVAPIFLILIFLLNLPCTVNRLLFVDLPTPTC